MPEYLGEIIFQKEVKIINGDTTKSLHDRIKINENEWYPKVLDHVINSKPMSFLSFSESLFNSDSKFCIGKFRIASIFCLLV